MSTIVGGGGVETLTYLCVILPGALQKIKEKVRKQKEMLSKTEESKKDDLGTLPASKMKNARALRNTALLF